MTAEDEDVVGELTTDLLARGEWSLRVCRLVVVSRNDSLADTVGGHSLCTSESARRY
jgi:hypothetical protein